jgi:hypothetical protein
MGHPNLDGHMKYDADNSTRIIVVPAFHLPSLEKGHRWNRLHRVQFEALPCRIHGSCILQPFRLSAKPFPVEDMSDEQNNGRYLFESYLKTVANA